MPPTPCHILDRPRLLEPAAALAASGGSASPAAPRAVVIGDAMVDVYLDAAGVGLSDEAPVIVVDWQREQAEWGGMLNVARSLAAAGFARVDVIGLVSASDEPGRFVREAVDAHASLDGHWFDEPGRPTTCKTRIVVDGRDHIARIDREDARPIEHETETAILSRLAHLLSGAAVVVVSDYAKGLFTPSLARSLVRMARERRIPVVVDSKPEHLDWFVGADLFTPNFVEARAVLDLIGATPPDAPETAGEAGEGGPPSDPSASTEGVNEDEAGAVDALDAVRIAADTDHALHPAVRDSLRIGLGVNAGRRLLAHLRPAVGVLVTLGPQGMIFYERTDAQTGGTEGSAAGAVTAAASAGRRQRAHFPIRAPWPPATRPGAAADGAARPTFVSAGRAGVMGGGEGGAEGAGGDEVVSIRSTSGAGDVVVAVLAAGLVGCLPVGPECGAIAEAAVAPRRALREVLPLASYAVARAIRRPGTATLRADDLADAGSSS